MWRRIDFHLQRRGKVFVVVVSIEDSRRGRAAIGKGRHLRFVRRQAGRSS